MSDALDLAGLLVARICHDIAGPVGALVNGAELLADEPDPDIRAEFTGMIADGAGKIGARLRFLRLAFGGPAAGPDMTAGEVRAALGGMLAAEGRLALDWRIGAERLRRDHARLLMALALCAAEAVEGRGTLILEDAAACASGARVRLSDQVADVLEGQDLAGPPTSGIAPALMAASLACRERVVLRLDANPGWLRIAVARP